MERQELHELVERIPEPELPAAKRMLQSLLADPLWLSLLTAPPDDEPYTEEQQLHDAEARAAIERGEGIPHEQILREFGL